MTKQQKNELVSLLTDEFKSSNAIVVADYKGMTVNKLEALRNVCREKGIKVRVVKNTLATIALKNAGIDSLELKETNILAWGNDQLELAKVIVKYAEADKTETFVVKSGHMEGIFVDRDKIVTLSKLPSREELIGMLLSVWTSPARMFVTGLDNLRKKLEENQ